MPNIEIHGLRRKEAETLRKKIFKEFEGESYLEETVVTVFQSTVKDVEGKDQPFLRLIDDTGDATTRKILGKLAHFKLDIEYFKLTLFASKIT